VKRARIVDSRRTVRGGRPTTRTASPARQPVLTRGWIVSQAGGNRMIISTRCMLPLFLSMIMLYGCEGLLITDTRSLLAPTFTR
jgi:hypothetical protein